LNYTAEEIIDYLINYSHTKDCATKAIPIANCGCLREAALKYKLNELKSSLLVLTQKINRRKTHFTGYFCGTKNRFYETLNFNDVTCSHCLKGIARKPALIVPIVADPA